MKVWVQPPTGFVNHLDISLTQDLKVCLPVSMEREYFPNGLSPLCEGWPRLWAVEWSDYPQPFPEHLFRQEPEDLIPYAEELRFDRPGEDSLQTWRDAGVQCRVVVGHQQISIVSVSRPLRWDLPIAELAQAMDWFRDLAHWVADRAVDPGLFPESLGVQLRYHRGRLVLCPVQPHDGRSG